MTLQWERAWNKTPSKHAEKDRSRSRPKYRSRVRTKTDCFGSETPNIREASLGWACAIEGKTATGIEEPVVMDMSGAGRRDPSARNPKRMVVGPESPRESRRGEGGGEATRSGSRNESEKGEIDPERLSSRVPEIMAVGPDRPRESRGKEGDSKRTRIDSLKECKWKGPPASNKRIVIVGPESPRVVEYECIIAVFILSLWTGQVWAISVNSIKGSCPKIVTI